MKIVLWETENSANYFVYDFNFKSLWAAAIMMARLAKEMHTTTACIVNTETGEVVAQL